MYVLNLCSDPGFLRVVNIIKIVVNIIMISIPLALIVSLMVDMTKAIMKGEDEVLKTLERGKTKVISAITVFLVPSIVTASFNLITVNGGTLACWEEANTANIAALQSALDAESLAHYNEVMDNYNNLPDDEIIGGGGTGGTGGGGNGGGGQVPDNPGNIPSSGKLTPFVNGTQRALNTGDCMSASDNCKCPTRGRFTGFSFTMESSTGRNFKTSGTGDGTETVSVTCSDGSKISKSVNKKVTSNFRAAFEKICLLKTTGINGVKIDSNDLYLDGVQVRRLNSKRTICSNHAYGNAIDISYNKTITVNGVGYKPYSSQGTSTKAEYDRFVAALGRENHPKNINYILWIYAFSPNGFNWGGNWSAGSFDPMHFEVAS